MPTGEARTRQSRRRSAFWVRGRLTGSWIRSLGTAWRGGPDRQRRVPPITDHSVPGAAIQPSSIQRCSSLFTGSANGMLSVDAAEISAVWEAKQAVLPQRQPSGQQRPSPQHFHPLEQQPSPQHSPLLSQMLELQQRSLSRSMH